MKYKVCLIIPYFGKLPNYFQLWLNSCKCNNNIDFLLYIDDKTEYEFPVNVKVKYTTFNEIKERIKLNFDFDIKLEETYKLCDYKVTYGEVFSEDIKEYDFWGHCDIDTIWGDINKFITDEILEKYDKILPRGHFSLYKNNPEVNARYKNKLNGKEIYKEAFKTNNIYVLDEWDGLYKIYKDYNYNIYEEEIAADISVKYQNLYINSDKKSAIFSWNIENGKSKIYSYTYKNKIIKKEYMYIHLQKRKMNIISPIKQYEKEFLIIPNEFTEGNIKDIDKKLINRYTKLTKIRGEYIKMRIKNYLKKRIKKD